MLSNEQISNLVAIGLKAMQDVTGYKANVIFNDTDTDKLGEAHKGTITLYPQPIADTIQQLHPMRLNGLSQDQKHSLLILETLAHEYSHTILDKHCYAANHYTKDNLMLLKCFKLTPRRVRSDITRNTSVVDTIEDIAYRSGNVTMCPEEFIMLDYYKLHTKNELLQAHEWAAQLGGQFLLGKIAPQLEANEDNHIASLGKVRTRVNAQLDACIDGLPLMPKLGINTFKNYLGTLMKPSINKEQPSLSL